MGFGPLVGVGTPVGAEVGRTTDVGVGRTMDVEVAIGWVGRPESGLTCAVLVFRADVVVSGTNTVLVVV